MDWYFYFMLFGTFSWLVIVVQHWGFKKPCGPLGGGLMAFLIFWFLVIGCIEYYEKHITLPAQVEGR